MSELKATPWNIVRAKNTLSDEQSAWSAYNDQYAHTSYVRVANSDGKVVALAVYGSNINFDDADDSLDVAALIAASPELYAALEALFACDMEHVLMFDGKEDQVAAIQLARAALKKARGEA